MAELLQDSKRESIPQEKQNQNQNSEDENEKLISFPSFGLKISKDRKAQFRFKNRNYEIQLDESQDSKEILDVVSFFSYLCKEMQSKEDNRCSKKASFYDFSYMNMVEYFILKKANRALKKSERDCEENCCICQCELYDDVENQKSQDFYNQIASSTDEDVIQPINCDGHFFHSGCLKHMIKDSHFKCPICLKIYGVMVGDQPEGQMTYSIDPLIKCSGYQCGTIIIIYKINGGVRNGVQFQGTSRGAYLPDNEEGREILELLKKAFQLKLIFTVGRSVTTGIDNCVVWNGIHHKTNITGGSAYFGYPDPTYFIRVKEELALKGVV